MWSRLELVLPLVWLMDTPAWSNAWRAGMFPPQQAAIAFSSAESDTLVDAFVTERSGCNF